MNNQEALLSTTVETPQKMFVWAISKKSGELRQEQFNQLVRGKSLIKLEFAERLMVGDLTIMTRQKTGVTEEVGVDLGALEAIIPVQRIMAVGIIIREQGLPEMDRAVEWKLDIEQYPILAQELKRLELESQINDFMQT